MAPYGKMGGREESKLSAAKRSYRSAKAEGNHQEEAKWANVIGHILKDRGEYVEALRWLRLDYEISFKFLTQRHCFATCQSLGEVYLLLKDFKEALSYQKKHLELAKDANDLAEQQRANTQLGRTYYEMLLSFKDDNNLVMSAKKYFNSAMELAQALKDNPPANNCSFLEEYIDAHNNIGMLEMELDNFEEAQKILSKGLEICDEEEVMGDDAGRSRLHHNLGFVYMELRMWVKAKYHMEKDIVICKRIGHCQGEAKGYINLGVLHYRNQRYNEALDCYKRAHNLAKSMEDEDSLVGEIDQNIESAKEAKKIMGELTKEEQNLKKLKRDTNSAKRTSRERNCLLQQNASLDCLIDKARLINLWLKLLEFGKKKKGIASELCDKEKLSDSFMFIGEAYENLRKFSKARKWYAKSWETYKSIGNLEGQAMAQLNIGNVLDSDGNWQEALDAYEECYRIATEAKLDSIQLTALENMNYSHLIRFNNVDMARKYQLLINKLKESKNTERGKQDVMTENYCSESDTEGNIHTSNNKSNACNSPETSANVEEMSDDVPLISLLQSTRGSPKIKPTNMEKQKTSSNFKNFSPKGSSRSISNQETVGRKRVRVVLSDDEDETFVEMERSKGRTLSYPVEDVATSDEFKSKSNTVSPVCVIQDVSVASKCTIRSCTPVNIEESSNSYKNTGPFVSTQNGEVHRSSSAKKNDQCITIKVDKELIHVEAVTLVTTDKLSTESVKVELACLYYLQIPGEKRSEGLFPIIQHIRCGDRVIESLETIETLKDQAGQVFVEAFIDGWVQKRLIKLYIDSCKEVSETPNMKLLKKLYNLEVSDDEITVSDCELQDISVTPLLNALHAHKTFAVLDLSHNLLGNVTMEKLQRVFTDSGQKYGGLMLDLHCNRFGPTALFQICECPSLFARLEVLNIAGNRLTDACASYLSTILQNCRALCSLNIEGCSITSRTFQKVADALDSGSAMEQLFVGHNNPVSGNAIVNLLVKLTALKRFSTLSLNGLKLGKPVIDSLGLLAKTSSLSALMLGETGIGTEGALAVTEFLFKGSEDSVKLDLSYCGLTSEYILKLNADASIVCCILELNLAGNPIAQQGTTALSALLLNPQCCLKVLVLEKCRFGVAGILQILKALADNNSLEDLNLADNADVDQGRALQHDITSTGCTEILQPQTNIPESSPKMCAPKEVEPAQQGLCPENADLNQLQVADSEDEHIKVGAMASGTDDSCASSCQRNSSPECQLIQELSTAISKAKKLQLLDLSNNGFSTQAAELFAAWSSSRPCPAYRHIKDQIIHLFTEGKKCCIKPCCKKD